MAASYSTITKNSDKKHSRGRYKTIFIVVLVTGLLNSLAPAAEPDVVPSLREWKAASGTFDLTTNSRIVIDQNYYENLLETAELLSEDMTAVCGIEMTVTKSSSARAGDIFLTLDNKDSGIGNEGYLLETADKVTIRANTSNGAFYGTQTVLQMLKQSASKRSLERGTARDFPAYRERGIMIDVGRKYWQMDYLETTMRNLAWHKMNFIHLHFTEWRGFRLQSGLFPGLAAPQAYSKADIQRLQQVAKRYHLTLVPEIDLPAHATAITDYNPYLAFSCPSMRLARWQGDAANKADRAWTLDVTRREVRSWIASLLDEFIPLFDGPYFHIGGDEWQYDEQKYACPELIAAMKAKGYSQPGDLFVEWVNEINAQVKSYGKRTQIWNWWRFSPNKEKENKTSIQPDKDIIVNVWNSPRQEAILTDGYEVIITPEEMLYVSPGLINDEGYGVVDTRKVYEDWVPDSHPNIRGFKICIWSDNAEDKSDEWFERHGRKPKAVLAERLWGGPRSENVKQFFKRVQKVGAAPEK